MTLTFFLKPSKGLLWSSLRAPLELLLLATLMTSTGGGGREKREDRAPAQSMILEWAWRTHSRTKGFGTLGSFWGCLEAC